MTTGQTSSPPEMNQQRLQNYTSNWATQNTG